METGNEDLDGEYSTPEADDIVALMKNNNRKMTKQIPQSLYYSILF